MKSLFLGPRLRSALGNPQYRPVLQVIAIQQRGEADIRRAQGIAKAAGVPVDGSEPRRPESLQREDWRRRHELRAKAAFSKVNDRYISAAVARERAKDGRDLADTCFRLELDWATDVLIRLIPERENAAREVMNVWDATAEGRQRADVSATEGDLELMQLMDDVKLHLPKVESMLGITKGARNPDFGL